MNQTPSQVNMDQTIGPSAPLLCDTDPPYEGEGRNLPPPPDMVPGRGTEPPVIQTNWNIPAISEGIAREAFIEYAASKCCYSKAPAKEMVFQDLQSFNTYRYRLETFTESRSTVNKVEPYRGEVIDYHMNGVIPLPWDIRVEVPDMFKDTIKEIKMPYTSSLKGCSVCGCGGRRPCGTCNGSTRQRCLGCGANGRIGTQRCSLCSGMSTIICQTCGGIGTVACRNCEGKGQLLSYVELQVEWKNNIFEYVADQKSGFPTELFKSADGERLFVDEQHMVYPVVSFPDYAINEASRNAVEQHHVQFASTSRILRQRQTIELIFLTRVEYEWRGKSYCYYVYGNDHQVYAEKYPRKCCCTII
uniref:Protein SSUH2 homolog n=1 Tax=Salvator merianae TaxID=96440 RepID=A0A8D0B8E1_SALMN